MTDSSPDIEVTCPECERTLTKPTKEEAEALVESHNEARHGGNHVASVNGEKDPLHSTTEILDDFELRGDLGIYNRNDGYRVMCGECECIGFASDQSEAWVLADQHDELSHGGDATAGILEEDLTGEAAERKPPITSSNAVEKLAETLKKPVTTNRQSE